MSSTSEVGHAKNVANLQKITQQVSAYSLYNPSVDEIKVANLQSLYTNATAKLTEVENKRNANKNAIAARQTTFEDLKSTCTKIINFLDILDLPEGILKQAKSLNRAIQGGAKKTEKPVEEGKEESKSASISRQSFTQQTENFGILVQLLETLPSYAPNEENLKIVNLSTYHQALKLATLAVDQTESQLNTKMIERDKILYEEETGVYDISQKIKKYVKSAYGATSQEFTTVSAIKFTEK